MWHLIHCHRKFYWKDLDSSTVLNFPSLLDESFFPRVTSLKLLVEVHLKVSLLESSWLLSFYLFILLCCCFCEYSRLYLKYPGEGVTTGNALAEWTGDRLGVIPAVGLHNPLLPSPPVEDVFHQSSPRAKMIQWWEKEGWRNFLDGAVLLSVAWHFQQGPVVAQS